MCGIFAVIGSGIVLPDLQVFRDLGIVSQLRGEDSAGVYQDNTRAKNWNLEAHVRTEGDFMYLKQFHEKDVINSINANFLLGHTRQATIGAKTIDNAQPVKIGNIVGVHNGTLKDEKYKDKSGTKSDSVLMFEDIAERGIVPVLEELDEKSAYSIIMLDKSTGDIFFARNNLRPLYFGINQKRNVMYCYSDSKYLKPVLDDNSIDYKSRDDKTNTTQSHVYYTNDGTIFRFNASDVKPRVNILKTHHVIYEWLRDDKGMYHKVFRKDAPKTKPVEVTTKTEILPFNPPVIRTNRKSVGKDFTVQCDGCSSKLTVWDQYKIRNYADCEGYHDIATGKYYCEGCVKGNYRIPKQQTTH